MYMHNQIRSSSSVVRMTSPGTIKSIQKRFYTVVVSASPSSSAVSTSRVRSNSASRNLYTSSASATTGGPSSPPSLPLSFFDSPPPPPPSGRPGNPHVISTTRLPIKGDGSNSGGGSAGANGAGAEGQQHHHTQNTNTSHSNGHQPPFSLALTPSQPPTPSPSTSPYYYYPSGHPFFPCNSVFASRLPIYSARANTKEVGVGGKNGRRYQLDVGAYGIAKKSSQGNGVGGAKSRGKEEEGDLGLSVQVGEDAYFIRDNAMGVADGVGGWARAARHSDLSKSSEDPSPSALFARRLMNFCSAEMGTAALSSFAHTPPINQYQYNPTSYKSFSFPTQAHWHRSQLPFPPHISHPPPPPCLSSPSPSLSSQPDEYDELDMDMDADPAEDIDVDMTELEEGLDVLMILERAYESAIKAHVIPASSSSTGASAGSSGASISSDTDEVPTAPKPNGSSSISVKPPAPTPSTSPHARPTHTRPMHTYSTPNTGFHSNAKSPTTTTPLHPPAPKQTPMALLEGSSTALLAVLDHSPRVPRSRIHSHRLNLQTQTPKSEKSLLLRSKIPSLKSLYPTPRPVPHSSKYPPNKGVPSPAPARKELAGGGGSGAVLKIAHLGDCMGMLVREDEIVWRSEEMWWSFNTPVQLGPLSPSKPSTHARTFTLPIEQDDILILASDGLSDNLWDEEVLDEVVRMKRSFLPGSGPTRLGSPSPDGEKGGRTTPKTTASLVGRRTLAGMLSEALCSRARRVSERRPRTGAKDADEVPFARRAREQGRAFRGGKVDDISVVVAVISPADLPKPPPS